MTEFTVLPYFGSTFLEQSLPAVPKGSGVYKIFDTRGRLIVLDKSSNLFLRLERFFGERTELVKDLDLREITSRIEFVRTWSPFETAYVLYLERRHYFPKTYRKMRTFRLFSLMKINRKQRFPRIYTSRQIKAGVDYFGPFVSRGQFGRLKTSLERTFKLRPCPFNIRGNDPHPDCMYFQMHTCSRPCNNDIDRSGYLADIETAMAFIEGRDEEIESALMERITRLSSEEKFEEAEAVRRKLEKVRRARQEVKDTFGSVWSFDYVVVLPADSVARTKIAFVRGGNILGLKEYEVETLGDLLPNDLAEAYSGPLPGKSREFQYDEFCLVANFVVSPLQSVHLIPVRGTEDMVASIRQKLRSKRGRSLKV